MPIPSEVFLLNCQLNIWNRSTNCRQNTPTHSHTDKTNFTLGWVIHMQLKLTRFPNQIILWHDSQYLLNESVNSHAYIIPQLLVSKLLFFHTPHCLPVYLCWNASGKHAVMYSPFADGCCMFQKRESALPTSHFRALCFAKYKLQTKWLLSLCETLSLYYVSSGNILVLASYNTSTKWISSFTSDILALLFKIYKCLW